MPNVNKHVTLSTHNNYKQTIRAVKHKNTDNSATCLVIVVVVLALRHCVLLNIGPTTLIKKICRIVDAYWQLNELDYKYTR